MHCSYAYTRQFSLAPNFKIFSVVKSKSGHDFVQNEDDYIQKRTMKKLLCKFLPVFKRRKPTSALAKDARQAGRGTGGTLPSLSGGSWISDNAIQKIIDIYD